MGGPTGITLLPGGSGKARLWFQAQVTPFGQALVDLISSAVLAAALCLLLVLPSTGQACSTVTCFSPSTGSGTHPCSFHSQTGYSPFGDGVFCLLNASNGFKMASLPIFSLQQVIIPLIRATAQPVPACSSLHSLMCICFLLFLHCWAIRFFKMDVGPTIIIDRSNVGDYHSFPCVLFLVQQVINLLIRATALSVPAYTLVFTTCNFYKETCTTALT